MQTKSIPYTFIRGGYFYFSRRVPSDLRHYYSSSRVVQGLRTSSPQRARVQANIAVAKLDAYWSQMRMSASNIIGSSLIKAWETDPDSRPKMLSNLDTAQAGCPTLLIAYKPMSIKVNDN